MDFAIFDESTNIFVAISHHPTLHSKHEKCCHEALTRNRRNANVQAQPGNRSAKWHAENNTAAVMLTHRSV